jgi:hypothetical protein
MVDDADRTKRVICLVTYAALTIGRPSMETATIGCVAWLEHRGDIEAIASLNYDDGKFNEGGEVLIETEDLTPDE